MKKRIMGKKLSRAVGARTALKRSLLRAFVLHGKIKTTKAKAKFVQRDIEKNITLARKGDLASIKKVFAYFAGQREVATKFIKDSQKIDSKRKAGFTKITSLPPRKGDNADLAFLEWVDKLTEDVKQTKKKAKEDKKSDLKKAQDSVKPKTKKRSSKD